MPYRLTRKEKVPDGIRRIGCEQLDAAIASLEGASTPTARSNAVHDTRKRLKKVRALLKLARPALGTKVYRAENDAAREAGRLLSVARDADATIEVFDVFARESAILADGGADVGAVRAELLDVRRRTRAELERSDVVPSVLQRLRATRRRAERWTLPDDDWAVVSGGFRRAYRRARKAFRAALEDPTPERLHEFRKRTKDLRYQLRILRRIWPAVMERTVDQAHRLSTLLGDDHDLVVLGEPLGQTTPLADADTRTQWREAIAARRRALLAEAEPLGHRLLAEKSARATTRLRSYWTAWRQKPDDRLSAAAG